MTSSVPSQLLAAIKGRKFTSVARLFAPQTEFEAWTNVGHWVARDGQTAAKIIEAWYAPGAGASTVVSSNEIQGARGFAVLECELTWSAPPDDHRRVAVRIDALQRLEQHHRLFVRARTQLLRGQFVHGLDVSVLQRSPQRFRPLAVRRSQERRLIQRDRIIQVRPARLGVLRRIRR